MHNSRLCACAPKRLLKIKLEIVESCIVIVFIAPKCQSIALKEAVSHIVMLQPCYPYSHASHPSTVAPGVRRGQRRVHVPCVCARGLLFQLVDECTMRPLPDIGHTSPSCHVTVRRWRPLWCLSEVKLLHAQDLRVQSSKSHTLSNLRLYDYVTW